MSARYSRKLPLSPATNYLIVRMFTGDRTEQTRPCKLGRTISAERQLLCTKNQSRAVIDRPGVSCAKPRRAVVSVEQIYWATCQRMRRCAPTLFTFYCDNGEANDTQEVGIAGANPAREYAAYN